MQRISVYLTRAELGSGNYDSHTGYVKGDGNGDPGYSEKNGEYSCVWVIA